VSELTQNILKKGIIKVWKKENVNILFLAILPQQLLIEKPQFIGVIMRE